MSPFLADTLLYTGALIALVLVLRRPVARLFGAQAAYALWALPALRLLLPPIELPASWAPAAPAAQAPVETVVYLADTPAAEPAFALTDLILPLWLAGAAVLLLWRVVTYRRMRAMLLADAVPVGEAGKVRLVETPAVAAPVAFGVRDKVVALPLGFMAWHDRTARDLALAHELAHHRGHDLLVNMAAQPLLALHWFNPVAWLGWRAMRRDQEAACDARVLAGQGCDVRADYGRLIASLAGGPRLALAAPMACPVLGEKSIIHRLRSLTMPEPTARRRRMARGLIWGAALALPLTATIGYAAPDAPTPPAPPSAPDAPAAPEGKHVEKHVVIIHHKDGQGDPAKMKTRTVTKDGKTITITTDEDLTDAQLDAKIAEIEAGKGMMMVAPPEPPAPPAAPGAAVAPAAPHREIRRIVITSDGKNGGDHEAMAMDMSHGAMACSDKDGGTSVVTEEGDGKRKMVKVKLCAAAHAAGAALEGLKHARDRIASDPKMPANVRDEVLKSLDEEIAKLAGKG